MMTDWKCMQSCEQDMTVKTTSKKTTNKEKKCAHELNELPLNKEGWTSEHGATAHEGPHPMRKMCDNGAVPTGGKSTKIKILPQKSV